ncbi:MAG: class V aminotransferase [Clostridiaceae bacterium BRH_c20a]|nr:MAG: class V aminotransferase [Clostridiaceae bacterium BRH_c20a]
MEQRNYLQIPGPTNVPDRILKALSKPLVNHRGEQFKEIMVKSIEGLKEIFRTDNDILIFPSSGSGVLESSIVNLFSPGDTLLISSNGVFSERVALISETYGINVIRITKEWGQAIKPEDVRKELEKDTEKKIKAVCLPQNETTSAITNDIEGISRVIKERDHPALFLVDVISSLASLPLETDNWGIDVAIGASQKGLMLPPGMGIVTVSKKAWEAVENSKLPKWYWDYKAVKSKMESYQFPYTPPTSLFFGLVEAIDMIREEGLENIWDRHNQLARAVRAATVAMGLKIFSEKGYESDTVTAIVMPEGIDFPAFSKVIRTNYGVVLGGGLQKLSGKIFRIGHMGSISKTDIYAIMGAVEMSLYELGYAVELGTAAKAVSGVFLK